MSASKKITKHLGKHQIDFEIVSHRKVYTAYDLAQTLGAKLEDIAKTLLISAEIPELKKKGKHHFVVVVPASYHVDLKKVKKLLGAKKIEIATEKMMKKLKMKPGALTPFGSTRGFGVIVDKSLLKTKSVLMGAESFTESVRVKVKDFVKVENPLIGIFGKKNTLKLQKKAGKRQGKKGTKKARKGAKKTVKKTASKKAVKKKVAKKKPLKKKVAPKRKVVKKKTKKRVAPKRKVAKKLVKKISAAAKKAAMKKRARSARRR